MGFHASHTVLEALGLLGPNKNCPCQLQQRISPSKRMDLEIKVTCVLNHEDEYPTDALLLIKDHCDLLNIPFYTRAFDSIKFSEDRKYIQKLPAFHIFVKGLHKDTFYTDSSPKLKIRSMYDECKEKAAAKAKAKRNTWSIFKLFSFITKKPLKLMEWK
jgi:hypothetical protein